MSGGEDRMKAHLDEHMAVARAMEPLLPVIERVAVELHAALARGGRLFTCGNGGSAADAQHLAAELVGRFRRERKPLAAFALTGNSSAITCIANDYSYDDVFARQLEALCGPGDVVLAISTSGKSPNTIRALETAKARGALGVALTGNGGGSLATHAAHAIVVPSAVTARIQEMHVLAIHMLCERIDELVLG
jgi:D-sedoheptulose 7-phosphate isomerase